MHIVPDGKFSSDDGFWDISDIVPRRQVGGFSAPKNGSPSAKKRGVDAASSPDIDAVEISIGGKGDGSFPHGGQLKSKKLPQNHVVSLLAAYENPSPLIASVKITDWPTAYTFYEQFESDCAALSARRTGNAKRELVPFFSYVPQFLALNTDQLAFYLWWRECFFEGRATKTEFCYIQLLIFETLNLTSKISPKRGVLLLGHLWNAYRADFPKIDRFLAEWLCDYSLIHNVSLPRKLFMSLYQYAARASLFREYYFSEYVKHIGGESESAAIILAYGECVGYSGYRNLAAYEQNSALFDTHMPRLAAIIAEHVELAKTATNSVRDSYVGAVCSYRVKRKIMLDYTKIAAFPDSDRHIIMSLRYAEERLLASLGLRGRGQTGAFLPELRRAIDVYLDAHGIVEVKQARQTARSGASLSARRSAAESARRNAEKNSKGAKNSATEPASDYAAAYENDYAPINYANSALTARGIELASRHIIGALEVYENDEPTVASAAAKSADSGDLTKRAIAALLDGNNEAFIRTARENNLLPDTLAEKINALALEKIGDVAVDFDGTRFVIIEDYREDMRGLFE